jgi:hypothetical protein
MQRFPAPRAATPNVLANAIDHLRGLLWSDNVHPRRLAASCTAKVVREAVLSALRRQPRLRRWAPRHHVRVPGFLLHASYATLY